MLQAGVAGAGVFGGYHARKLAEQPGVRLVRVFDHDAARASALAQPRGGEGVDDLAAFLDGLDLVVIATPAESHAELGLAALAAGAHLYVEKPLASSLTDADALVTAAAKSKRVGASGHQERVTFAAMGLLSTAQRPRSVHSVRRGLPSPRCRDVSCVLDLMIHDLDLALLLSAGDAVAVEAEGGYDTVKAEVVFSDGLVAVFEASREAPARMRTMRLEYDTGDVEIDFLAPSFRNDSGVTLDAAFASSATGRDPLGVSFARFVAAARGEGAPVATFTDAARALDLALAVEAAAGL
ncbi:Gfo/Idh/MocA family oxidoreductase [soil metagenome]